MIQDAIFNQFHRFLNELLPISETELQQVYAAFSVKSVDAKTVLIAEGDIARELYFIQQGLLRLFYTTSDKDEITGFIFSEYTFAGCLESFLTQQPSSQTLEALEPTVMLVISKESLEELYQEVPKAHVIMRKVMEHRFVSAQQILSSYILYKPEQRYVQFAQKFPLLLQRVPQHIIASFLGITPVSLSRIRNRIARQR